jgi:hypothetical protein
MKTTIQTLLKTVFDDNTAAKLNNEITKLYNKNQVSYDDILDTIQDTIFYNLSHSHKIEKSNFMWKFYNLLNDRLKHKKRANLISFELLYEHESPVTFNEYETTINNEYYEFTHK